MAQKFGAAHCAQGMQELLVASGCARNSRDPYVVESRSSNIAKIDGESEFDQGDLEMLGVMEVGFDMSERRSVCSQARHSPAARASLCPRDARSPVLVHNPPTVGKRISAFFKRLLK